MSSALDARVELALGAFRLDVALAMPVGGVIAVLGPSGSGKSTLLRCLAGIEPAVRGRIAVGDELWLDSARDVRVPAHRRGVGLVFQDSNLFPHLRVRGNLDYARRRARAAPAAGDALVTRLGVTPLLDRWPESLSGGERQRVAIARALLASPRLLLLDEPLASLDVAARGEILELLREALAHSAIPVVYVTHTRSEALQLADAVVLLDGGRVRDAGSPQAVALRAEPGRFGGEDELGAVVEGEVTAVDEKLELSTVAFPGGVLAVPGRLPLGARRRLEVLARDVSLALDEPRRTSILNVLPARVVEVRGAATPRPVVVLAVGGTSLLARVSRLSLEQLGIAAGVVVYAQVKAVALVA